MLSIVPVVTRKHWRDFHDLPHAIYRDDPHWIAPLRLERKIHFDRKHNPFFAHAEVAFWLAYRGDIPVGRISAQIDRLHLERYRDATGHFGFLDAVDDPAVFAALLKEAEGWLRDRGMQRALGPVSFSMWDEPGLLIEGFDTPPYVVMGHDRPYARAHIEALGYHGAQDLIAYDYDLESPLLPLAQRTLERARRSGRIVLRDIRLDRAHLDAEVALILDILNDAWSTNWGFVAMTPAEVADLASTFRLLLKPQDVRIAYFDGEPAGFVMSLPNLNEAIAGLDGRLFPFGWLTLLWRLKVRGVGSVRLMMLGIRKSLQSSPASAMLAMTLIEAQRSFYRPRRIKRAELGWVLDSNTRMRRVIGLVGAKPYKTYRVYEKALR